jgi:hypothetical protein
VVVRVNFAQQIKNIDGDQKYGCRLEYIGTSHNYDPLKTQSKIDGYALDNLSCKRHNEIALVSDGAFDLRIEFLVALF